MNWHKYHYCGNNFFSASIIKWGEIHLVVFFTLKNHILLIEFQYIQQLVYFTISVFYNQWFAFPNNNSFKLKPKVNFN